MTHADKKIAWCLKKAEQEGRKHRGLRQITPDITVSSDHIKKAEHNLEVMQYHLKGNYSDWAIHATFYAYYHCLLAILCKFGYESRNQECTFATIESLIEQAKISLTKEELHRIFATDQRDKLETADMVELRERFQYGTETQVEAKKIKSLLEQTKEFIEKAKTVLEQ